MSIPHFPIAGSAASARNVLALLLLALPFLALPATSVAAQTSIDEVREAFATADDRRAVVERLLPGTEARAYYEALLAIHEERWDAFDTLAASWDRLGQDAHFKALVHRRALLGFSAHPERTWTYLLKELAPELDHRSPADAASRAMPSRIDPAEIRAEAFAKRAFQDGLRPFARMGEAGRRMTPVLQLSREVRRNFLSSLERPDVPDLVRAIADDLQVDSRVAFGDHPIHSRLTLDQLEELTRLMPTVLCKRRYVTEYLVRLRPSPDDAWRLDDDLRAEVLHHRLLLAQRRGTATPELLLEYLRVAPPAAYVHATLRDERRRAGSDARASGPLETGLEPFGDDTPFVRELLIGFLQAGARVDPFKRTVDFHDLIEPGTYVVEFAGGGVTSRVLVEKGRLELVERLGAAGHVLHVIDENGVRLGAASIWFAGRELEPDERGECLLPFATQAGEKTLILRHGRRAAWASIQHAAEAYELSAFVHVDRETLIPNNFAPILVRPRLAVHGAQTSLALLEDPVLTVVSTRHDGLRSTQSIRNPELHGDGRSRAARCGSNRACPHRGAALRAGVQWCGATRTRSSARARLRNRRSANA